MDEKTLQAVTALANKLGTTAEYLWGVLVRQAPISGAITLILCAAWAAAAIWVWRTVHSKTSGERPEWTEEGAVFGWAGAFFFCGLCGLIASLEITGAITALVNPEFWALKQVLK